MSILIKAWKATEGWQLSRLNRLYAVRGLIRLHQRKGKGRKKAS
jgi:hypothetical protein